MCSLIPASLVELQLQRMHLASHRSPDHLNSIIGLRRVLVLKVMSHLLQPSPHGSPLVPGHASENAQQGALPHSIRRTDEHAELRVVEDVLERELDLVADYDGDAVADDGVEEAVRGGRVAGDVQSELGRCHAFGGTPDPVLSDAPVGEVDVPP